MPDKTSRYWSFYPPQSNIAKMPRPKRYIGTVDLTEDDVDVSLRTKLVKPGTSFSSSWDHGCLPLSSSHTRANDPAVWMDKSYSQAERNTWVASTREQEEDIAREITLTEDFDDDVYENYRLYGILNTKIVGCR